MKVPPEKPLPPTLQAAGVDSIRVKWTLPPRIVKAGSFASVSMKADGSSDWHRVDGVTGILGASDALPFPLSTTEIVVQGLDATKCYVAKLRLGNQFGWGPDSEVSTGLQLSSLRPLAAAAPVLEAVGETSMRVHWTLPPLLPGAPPFTDVAVYIREGTQGTFKAVDSTTTLVTANGGISYLASLCKAEVTGLSPDVTYFSYIKVMNVCGWGPSSEASIRGLQLPCSDAEVTGTSTRAERDVELRKRAIDVESATLDTFLYTRVQSRIPDPKRVKKE